MSVKRASKVTGALVAASFLVSSTGAIAATQQRSVDPWLALSSMSPSSQAASTAAVAQSDVRYNSRVRGTPLPALAVILATLGVAIYILLSDPEPNSPA